MNKQIEALKMAIEALKDSLTRQDVAINTCEEALEEAEKQEPVAWIKDVDDKGIIDFAMITEDGAYPVYRHPATWQSLSDDEIQSILDNSVYCEVDAKPFARAIEAKLKEKNHGHSDKPI